MFGWLRPDPKKRLEKRYKSKLEEAMAAQRKGDIPLFAELSAEADELRVKLENTRQAS